MESNAESVSSEEKPECPICFEHYDQFDKNRQAITLSCLHTFCLGCIGNQQICHGRIDCSICRRTENVMDLSELSAKAEEVLNVRQNKLLQESQAEALARNLNEVEFFNNEQNQLIQEPQAEALARNLNEAEFINNEQNQLLQEPQAGALARNLNEAEFFNNEQNQLLQEPQAEALARNLNQAEFFNNEQNQLLQEPQAEALARNLNQAEFFNNESSDETDSTSTMDSHLGENLTKTCHCRKFTPFNALKFGTEDEVEIIYQTCRCRSKGSKSFGRKCNKRTPYQEEKGLVKQLLEKRLSVNVDFAVESINQFKFSDPFGIAELKSLQVIVADLWKDKLLVFDSEGQFIKYAKMKRIHLILPSAIVVLPNGNLVVKDVRGLHTFDPTGRYMNSISKKLRKHYGLAIDRNANLLTIEQRKHELSVVVIDPNEKAIVRSTSIFESDGVTRLKALTPYFITYRPPNDILIVDSGSDTIYIVDMCSGVTKRKFGKSGRGAGEFNSPSGIVCDAEGYIIVADSRNHRIQVFTPDGDFIKILRINSDIRKPSGLFLTSDNGLFVSTRKGFLLLEI